MIMSVFWMSAFVRMKCLSCIDVEFYYVYREVQKSLSGISFSYTGCLVQMVTGKDWFYYYIFF